MMFLIGIGTFWFFKVLRFFGSVARLLLFENVEFFLLFGKNEGNFQSLCSVDFASLIFSTLGINLGERNLSRDAFFLVLWILFWISKRLAVKTLGFDFTYMLFRSGDSNKLWL
jgi:hypothetical protein